MTTYRHKAGFNSRQVGSSVVTVRRRGGGRKPEMLSGELSGGRHGTHGRLAWPSIIIMEVATMGLLVLTRKRLESIVIDCGNETIEVIIAEIRGDKVKIGVRASKDVQINRPEIREKKLNSAKKDGVK